MPEELTIEQLKEELTKRGVEFHHAAGLPKLSELWAIHSEDPIVGESENKTTEEGGEGKENVESPTIAVINEEPPTPKTKGKYKALRNVKHNGEMYFAKKRYDIREVNAKQLLKLGYIE